MVYEWDKHKETCYRVYVDEGKSMDELMEYMRVNHEFSPSKRAFQKHLRRWNFPSKWGGAGRDKALVERVRELWESNKLQREMLRVLHDEGFKITARQLRRLRAHNRWRMRGGNRFTSATTSEDDRRDDGDVLEPTLEPLLSSPHAELSTSKSRHQSQPTDGTSSETESESENESGTTTPEAADGVNEDNENNEGNGDRVDQQPDDALHSHASSPVSTVIPTSPLATAALRNEQRRQQLEAVSSERWETGKRRRYTRGWAGLPADPPGPPRFPSETTLAESKRLLGLDVDTYRDVRERFLRICEECGLDRKAVAGRQAWDAAKARLVRETAHLRTVMTAPPSSDKGGQEDDDDDEGRARAEQDRQMEMEMDARRALALDIICMDVTKRMRSRQEPRRPGIAEVRTILGLNPEESRRLRLAFFEILRGEQFTSKVEAGTERWEELKQRWIDVCPELRRAISPASTNDEERRMEVLSAFEMLAINDVRRWRDEQRLRRSSRVDGSNGRPGIGQQHLASEGDHNPDPSSPSLNIHVDHGVGEGVVLQHSGMEPIPESLEGIEYTHVNSMAQAQAHVHSPQLPLVVPGTPDHSQLQIGGVPAVSLHPSPQHLQDQTLHQLHSQHAQGSRMLAATPVIDPATGLALDPQINSSLLLAAEAQATVFVDEDYMQNLQRAAQAVAYSQQQQQHLTHESSQHSGPNAGDAGAGGLPVAVYLAAHQQSNLHLEEQNHHNHDQEHQSPQEDRHPQQPPGPVPTIWNATLDATDVANATSLNDIGVIAGTKFPGNILVTVVGVLKDITSSSHHHHHHHHHHPTHNDDDDDDDDYSKLIPTAAAPMLGGGGEGGGGGMIATSGSATGGGGEFIMAISSNEDLAEFLRHAQDFRAAPTFSVQLMHYVGVT